MLFEVSDLDCELDRPMDAANLLELELKHMVNRGYQNIGSGTLAVDTDRKPYKTWYAGSG